MERLGMGAVKATAYLAVVARGRFLALGRFRHRGRERERFGGVGGEVRPKAQGELSEQGGVDVEQQVTRAA